jgi:DNA-binding MarR family transcriptional regulator
MEMSEREMKARKIWQMQEIISHSLRTRARDEVKTASGEILAEKLPGRQNDTLVAVRHLCLERPEGIPLNQLARHMGVAPPAASVTVDLLVGQGYLERHTAPEDRRARRIRLSPKAEHIYMSGDKATLKIILRVAEQYPAGFLDEWYDFLKKIETGLEADAAATARGRAKSS